jgi:hemerythrin-like domain-containing protein
MALSSRCHTLKLRSREYITEFLREEHQKIEKVLCVLEQELTVFDRDGRPDYTKIKAVIRYFQEYPDCCHHPKEDLIFEKLKVRDPAAATRIGDIEVEHQDGAEKLQRLEDMMRSVLAGHDIPPKTFADVMREFIDQERKHMEMEERGLFRVAINTCAEKIG